MDVKDGMEFCGDVNELGPLREAFLPVVQTQTTKKQKNKAKQKQNSFCSTLFSACMSSQTAGFQLQPCL